MSPALTPSLELRRRANSETRTRDLTCSLRVLRCHGTPYEPMRSTLVRKGRYQCGLHLLPPFWLRQSDLRPGVANSGHQPLTQNSASVRALPVPRWSCPCRGTYSRRKIKRRRSQSGNNSEDLPRLAYHRRDLPADRPAHGRPRACRRCQQRTVRNDLGQSGRERLI